jgi:ZIP family zinc transporter
MPAFSASRTFLGMTISIVLLLALATSVSTMGGGLLAIALRDRLPLVLGFSAGAVIGVAFFDLLPESLAAGAAFHHRRDLLSLAALGFFIYALLDRLVAPHGEGKVASARGPVGAAIFSTHSLLDGYVLGVAFQAGHEIGIVVAAAILAHDFADGLNTVNVVLKNGGSRGHALRWLAVDSIAPLIGAGLSLAFAPPANLVGPLLAAFGGFFLYIGASDLLPDAYRARPRIDTTLAAVAGAGLLYLVTRLV